MLFRVSALCRRVLCCLVCYLLFECKQNQINYLGLGRARELVILLSFTRNFVVFMGFSSSSGCLRKAALFHCDIPFVFHIIILSKN